VCGSSSTSSSALRTLADRVGQTFTYPHTMEAASAEIRRLKGQTPTPPADRHHEKRAVERDMATGRGDDAQVQPTETAGYGSSAHWTHTDDQGPAEPTTTKRSPSRVELGAYTTADGHRRLVMGQRVDGEPCLVDIPAGDHGRVHLIERGLTNHAELRAIVVDYIEQSSRRGEPAIIARGENELTRQLQSRGA
jgi:hypothetical protein